jgi:multisubunit Na+/H+ antiporter MnhC subunit
MSAAAVGALNCIASFHLFIGRSYKLIQGMKPRDHNKTFVLIYTFFGGYVSVPLLAAPWVIISNSRAFSSPNSGTQVLIATITAIIIFLCLAVLFFSTAYSLYKRKPRARRMALISSIVIFPLCPLVTIYTWWFMHSEEARSLYYGAAHRDL